MTATTWPMKTILRRASASLSAASRWGATVIRGGIGLFYNQIDLNVATFPQLQERVLTRFGPNGEQMIANP